MASSFAFSFSIPKYDVFVSFLRQDTRRSLVSHLYDALASSGMDFFKDYNFEEERWIDSEELGSPIECSDIVVVILSKNYATSWWCLMELQLIMELYKKRGLGVIPVFYGVEPSAVRHQTGWFDLRWCQYDPQMADKVPRLREALKLIADLSGVESKLCNDEETMVDKIIIGCAEAKLIHTLKRNPLLFKTDEKKYDATVLHKAARHNYKEYVTKIIELCPSLVSSVNIGGDTPLHLAARNGNKSILVKMLESGEAACTKINKNGLTPLHCAAMNGSVEILKEFLNRTPSSFNVTTQGTMETVFHLAAKQKHIKAFTFMAESANIGKLLYEIDVEDNTVLHVAASVNSTYLVRYILKETTIDATLKNKKGSAAVDLLDKNGKDFGLLSHWLQQDEEKIQRPSKYVKFAPEAGEHNRNTNNGELLNSESFEKNLVKLDRRKKKEREMHTESLQNVRNTITIVAVLIASVAFTCGINPPGGVYQDGIFIGKATAGRTLAFKIFSIANNIALFTSLSIVTLLVSIISYRTNSLKKCVVIAHKMMWLAVASMVTSFTAAAWIIVPHSQGSKWLAYTTAAIATVPLGSLFVYVTFMMVKHILKKQSLRGNESQGNPAKVDVPVPAIATSTETTLDREAAIATSTETTLDREAAIATSTETTETTLDREAAKDTGCWVI